MSEVLSEDEFAYLSANTEAEARDAIHALTQKAIDGYVARQKEKKMSMNEEPKIEMMYLGDGEDTGVRFDSGVFSIGQKMEGLDNNWRFVYLSAENAESLAKFIQRILKITYATNPEPIPETDKERSFSMKTKPKES